MKKVILKGILVASLLPALAGCSDGDRPNDGATGRIAPVVSIDGVVIGEKPASRTQDISEENLYLKLSSADGSYSQTWNYITDFDPAREFEVGEYIMEAGYGKKESEGFETPAYYGSSRFNVASGKTTEVSLTASLAQAMVSISYTDNFKNYMSRYDASVESSTGNFYFYGTRETRPVYIQPGTTKIYVNFTKPNGIAAKAMISNFSAEARHHYKYTVDMTEQAGKSIINVTFDDTMLNEEVVIDISDEVLNAPAPSFSIEGFDEKLNVNTVEGFDTADPLDIGVIALGGIASVKMTTLSATLQSQGWPLEVDLMAPAPQDKSFLRQLGFECFGLWNNPDKMAAIDLTHILKFMRYIEGSNVSSFKFEVADRFGKTCDPVTVSITLSPFRFSLSNPSELLIGATTVNVELFCNAPVLPADLAVKYVNGSGASKTLEISGKENLGDNRYRLTLSGIPSDEKPLEITAYCNGRATEKLILPRAVPDFGFTFDDKNVFARTALVTLSCVTCDPALLARMSKCYAENADGSLGQQLTAVQVDSTADIRISGLNPGSSYKIKFGFSPEGGFSSPGTITTEAATQLPNNDMEDWSRTDGQTKYWWIEFPWANTNASPWGTMNQLTTSVGGSGTSMFSHTGTSYCAFSGTRSTTDHFSGTHAAVIETVGWGKNDANGNSAPKNVTEGQLYLGHYDNGAQYTGWAISSRPKSMTFYYKYNAHNAADFGYAEISIESASGAELAKGAKELHALDSYGAVTIPLTYRQNADKAAKIKVVFKSSGNPACINGGKDYMSYPGFGNLSDGRFTGSSLYVDHITLDY